MTNPKEHLEDYLRRFGLEGELAFHGVAYQYFLLYPERLADMPPTIVQKCKAAYHRIEQAEYVVNLLNQLVLIDPQGETLSDWYQFFVGRRYREGSGKFFTPSHIASVMARFLPSRPNPVLMDPTCGAGTFLLQASNNWKQDNCTLIANDIDSTLVELAMIVLNLATPMHHKKHFSSTDIYKPTEELTFWYGKVDYILANPPFSLRIEHETFNSPLFSLGYRNSDALFIDTAFNLLRPGGRLVCLMPHSIIANQEFADLRSMVETLWSVLGVICLPEGVFHLTAGTTTRADILVLEKKQETEEKTRRLVFASLPSVGMRLNTHGKAPISNDFEKLLEHSEVRKALSI